MADQNTDLTKDLGTELPPLGAEHDSSKDSEKKEDSAPGSILSTGEDALTSDSTDQKTTTPETDVPALGGVSGNTALPEGDVKDGSDEKKDGASSEALAPSVSESAPSAPLVSSDAVPAATEATSTSSTTEGAEDAKPSEAGASSQETVAPSASTPSVADKGAEAADSKGEDKDDTPKLAEPQPEAQPIVDIAPELADVLKEVGNKLTGALKKLGNYEDKFQKLESEAKARFDHVRQKATEVVAGLEAWFKRS